MKEIYNSQKLKKYHINDFIQYHERVQIFDACVVLISLIMKSNMRIIIKSKQKTLILITHQ